MAEEKQREERWLEYSLGKLDEESVSFSETVTWAAYHVSTQTEEDPPALTALLPLFYEKAATPAMVKHGIGCPVASYNLSQPKSDLGHHC